jgi:hypothetical protein
MLVVPVVLDVTVDDVTDDEFNKIDDLDKIGTDLELTEALP